MCVACCGDAQRESVRGRVACSRGRVVSKKGDGWMYQVARDRAAENNGQGEREGVVGAGRAQY
jgi:hypothetical protein